MQADFTAKLEQALSSERLAAYRQRLEHDGNRNLFSHYAWNMALSESLYPALQTMEVTLRNSIHNAACHHFGRDNWYDNRAVIRYPHDVAALDKAKAMLIRQHKALDPDRIIAELNFGFWTSLLDKRYEQVLWPQLIKTVFPYMPRRMRTRKVLSQRFHKIRQLRNRIFHHEPVWYWQDLPQQHEDILEAISWIEPAVKDLVMTIDRFPPIYQYGLQEIEQQLEKFC